MSKLENIDKNFAVKTQLEEKDIRFYNVIEPPFQLYGFSSADEGGFRRMPKEAAESVNEGVAELAANTAGGRVRFSTNSPYVAISAKYPGCCKLPHMPLTGSSGFDLYLRENGTYIYHNSFILPWDLKADTGYEAITYFNDSEMRDITINFPLYNDVTSLYIGVAEGSRIAAGERYSIEKPVVYYGSSITQGACASRPGNCYQAILSRRFDFDYLNLGFSGSARGEKTMAEYIAAMDMSCFVYDYDHNAPTAEHLRQTHEPMYRIIRDAHPDLPIIMMSRPDRCIGAEEIDERRSVILQTLENNREDKNLHFVDGQNIYKACDGDGTVDGCHPNDYGFRAMANELIPVFEKLF